MYVLLWHCINLIRHADCATVQAESLLGSFVTVPWTSPRLYEQNVVASSLLLSAPFFIDLKKRGALNRVQTHGESLCWLPMNLLSVSVKCDDNFSAAGAGPLASHPPQQVFLSLCIRDCILNCELCCEVNIKHSLRCLLRLMIPPRWYPGWFFLFRHRRGTRLVASTIFLCHTCSTIYTIFYLIFSPHFFQ
jgi:hypothetical protein